ncbi:hypothetical protein [Aeoliella sp. SH292]|uniref:hypothetical protein n=1 Tax=Aeoliella sp. SH292 TaxID=3454464 RepID=UPI003F9AB306
MPLIDILALITFALAGSMLLATGLGIALGHKTKVSERDRLIDGYTTGGILTLLARFREGWPTADPQLKWIFKGSLATGAIAIAVWTVSQWLT